jgi:hypothetical protein
VWVATRAPGAGAAIQPKASQWSRLAYNSIFLYKNIALHYITLQDFNVHGANTTHGTESEVLRRVKKKKIHCTLNGFEGFRQFLY